MTRDYKNVTEARARPKKTRSKPKATSSAGKAPSTEKAIPGWMWLVSGVVIGGFISFIVYLKLNVSVDSVNEGHQIELGRKGEQQANVDKKTLKTEDTKTELNKSNAEQLQFYKILPNREVTLPEIDSGDVKETSKTVKQESVKETQNSGHQSNTLLNQNGSEIHVPKNSSKNKSYIYTLQIGSFLSFKDADKRKANLGMLGIGSRIHAIKTGGKTHYRVLVGPYDDIKRVNEIDAAMKSNNIKTLLLRERG